MKYPLLLREILRHTPNDNPDQQHLEEAVSSCFFVFTLFSPLRLGDWVCGWMKGLWVHGTQGSWLPGLVLPSIMF